MISAQDMDTPWLVKTRHNSPRIRLFCFPYAGGGASVFRKWQQHLPADIQVCALQPPGRENRMADPLHHDVLALVSDIIPAIQPFLDRPFAFFGHSTGALVAFELIRKIRQSDLPQPLVLMVSGSRPPHIPEPRPIHHLPEPQFIEGLRRFSGTPEELLQNRELMDLYTPILRADLALEETYVHKEEALLDIPVAAVGGDGDREVSCRVLEDWKIHTRGEFSLKLFPGDHFYLRQEYPDLLSHMAAVLSQVYESCGK